MSDFESRYQDGYRAQRLTAGAPIVGDATVTRADANSLTRVDSGGGPRLFNLPALADVPIGWACYMQKVGGGIQPVTITPTGVGDTVNGAANDLITTSGAGAMIVAASATDWAALLIT